MFDKARTLFPLPIHDAFKAEMNIPNAHFCRMTLVNASVAETARIPASLVLLYPTEMLNQPVFRVSWLRPRRRPNLLIIVLTQRSTLLQLKRRPSQHIFAQFL
jgi:hypothetical protein